MAESVFADLFHEKLTVEEKISKAKIKLHRKSPFFSYLVEHLRFEKSDKVPSMGVNQSSRCIYSEEWVESLTLDVLMGTLAHEVSHLAFEHIRRGKNRLIMVNGFFLWNLAADITVNHYLGENDFSLPECGMIPQNGEIEMFGYRITDIANKSTEDIYEELKVHLKKLADEGKAQAISMPGDCSGDSQGNGQGNSDKDSDQPKGKKSKGSSGNKNGNRKEYGNNFKVEAEGVQPFDQHLWGNSDDGNDGDKDTDSNVQGHGDLQKKGSAIQEKNWGRILAEAYTHAKLIGREPAGFEREFGDIRKGRVNWRVILRRTIASKIPHDMTYARPNRKYIPLDLCLPSYTGESIKVIDSIDTSGSISQKDLSDFVSEIYSISRSFHQVEHRILTHDVDVHDDVKVDSYSMNKLKNLKIHGGGGTSHIPLYEYIKKKRLKRKENLQLLISFTDGFSQFPDRKPDIETIFVLAGNHIPVAQMPKWATTICID